nr:PREDICTED: uncharacterized protein LOC103280900 [Anolis carolinensis]|eukprot:XP_008119450.1 PREDICTED: uncharacterized protein LOC103280900 [Anolis carolinensis]
MQTKIPLALAHQPWPPASCRVPALPGAPSFGLQPSLASPSSTWCCFRWEKRRRRKTLPLGSSFLPAAREEGSQGCSWRGSPAAGIPSLRDDDVKAKGGGGGGGARLQTDCCFLPLLPLHGCCFLCAAQGREWALPSRLHNGWAGRDPRKRATLPGPADVRRSCLLGNGKQEASLLQAGCCHEKPQKRGLPSSDGLGVRGSETGPQVAFCRPPFGGKGGQASLPCRCRRRADCGQPCRVCKRLSFPCLVRRIHLGRFPL